MIVGCPVSVVRRHRPSSSSVVVICRQQLIQKDISSLTTGLIWIKFARNDPYMILFNNCSHGFGPLNIEVKTG